MDEEGEREGREVDEEKRDMSSGENPFEQWSRPRACRTCKKTKTVVRRPLLSSLCRPPGRPLFICRGFFVSTCTPSPTRLFSTHTVCGGVPPRPERVEGEDQDADYDFDKIVPRHQSRSTIVVIPTWSERFIYEDPWSEESRRVTEVRGSWQLHLQRGRPLSLRLLGRERLPTSPTKHQPPEGSSRR